MNNNNNNRYRMSSRDRRYTGQDPPSFSSTLLDSIYRSFDDREEPMAVKTTTARNRGSRDRIVDCWMEEEFGDRRRSLPTTSSDSSSLGFSSSDADSFHRTNNKKNKSLKPIRTSSAPPPPPQSERFSSKGDGSSGGRSSAKSRAMKFYGDLKRMKQPISPGGKLAAFLNSLFTATGTAKKQRISTSIPSTASTTTCSTASSYSRSCLSKTTSSSAAKRSVRFSPVSVVIDEDLTSSRSAMEKNRRVEEAAMELLRNYNKKWEVKEAVMEDEDVESCCSSDLFELENLLDIGVDRYCAELPVYETTHVDTNRAIASGLMV